MNGDKADAVSDSFHASRIAAHLQHVPFVEHDIVVDGHLNLAADHAVEEAAVIGQLQLRQAAADHIVVFHHHLFGDDAHIQQVAVKHLFTVTEARVEARMGIRVADQRDLIAHLQHRVPVRVGENTVAANTLDIAAGLAVDPQLAQIFAICPGHQFRPDAIGADHRQIDFAVSIGIQPALAGDLLGTGLQILVL